jgi:hypothetical protein
MAELLETEVQDIAIQIMEDAVAGKTYPLRLIYKGKSMAPVLIEGDQLLVNWVSPEKLHFGEIILYRNNIKFTPRRFLYKKKGAGDILYLRSKADNYPFMDDLFNVELLLGKVTEINKNGRRIRLDSVFWQAASAVIAFMLLFEGMIFAALFLVKKVFHTNADIPQSGSSKFIFGFLAGTKFLFLKTLLFILP